MVYISLILSIAILFFVVRLMMEQKRFDFLNGFIITGALIVVLLDIDTILSGRIYEVTTFINLIVIVLWIINQRRKPLENSDNE